MAELGGGSRLFLISTAASPKDVVPSVLLGSGELPTRDCLWGVVACRLREKSEVASSSSATVGDKRPASARAAQQMTSKRSKRAGSWADSTGAPRRSDGQADKEELRQRASPSAQRSTPPLVTPRWFDHHKCARIGCTRQTMSPGCAAVVVATDEKYRRKCANGGSQRQRLVAWVPNGRQALHRACWDEVKSLAAGAEKTLVASAAKSAEFYDANVTIRENARQAAEILLGRAQPGSKDLALAAFTGAGVSAAAGVATYRGTAGIDTMKDLGQHEDQTGLNLEDFPNLVPTKTHTLLAQMNAFVATQNCDNLHGKGGSRREKLSDLHGNIFIETCELCDKEHIRNFPVISDSTDASVDVVHYEMCPHCKWNHHTGRMCEVPQCQGRLRDTIVNFGDALGSIQLTKAIDAFETANMCLAFGSSLQVSPANMLPLLAKNLVIANLQETALDAYADVRVFCPSDDFMQAFVHELELLRHQPTATYDTHDEKSATSKKSDARMQALRDLREGAEFSEHIEVIRKRDARTVCLVCGGRVGKKGNALVLCDGNDMCPGAMHQGCMEDPKWKVAKAAQIQTMNWYCPNCG